MLFPTAQRTARQPSSRSWCQPGHGGYRTSGQPYRPHQPHYLFGSDHLGITACHDDGFVVAKPAPVSAPWLVDRVNHLEEKIGGSSTNLAAGLRVSSDLLQTTWPGVLRRIWLLSDGAANNDVAAIAQAIQEARTSYINVNCVAFGDVSGEALLRQIAASTHNGRFVTARTLHELVEALRHGSNGNGTPNGHHRRETTVVCVDVSKSMRGLLDGQRKIDLVKAALLDLIEWKRATFA